MASPAFKNLMEGVKEQFIPTFFRSKTNINPHHRISHPRLRHFKKGTGRKLRLPANLYTQKEAGDQKTAVSNYHASLDQRKQRKIKNRLDKVTRNIAIQGRVEHKANKPIIVED